MSIFRRTPRSSYILSALIVLLSALASIGGIFFARVYRDNAIVAAIWKANDAVTLVVALPLLVLSLVLAARGSARATLLWLAMLDYMMYNYAFYLFGSAFNAFFLVYAALFTLSLLALLFALVHLDVDKLREMFHPRTPVRWIGGYLAFVAMGLTIVYSIQSIQFILTGQLPPVIIMTGHPTSVVFALDLSLVVPFFILGAVWIWKRKSWGYVVAGIGTVKGAAYTLVLTVGSIAAMQAGMPEASAEIPFWSFLTLAGILAAAFLVGNLPNANRN